MPSVSVQAGSIILFNPESYLKTWHGLDAPAPLLDSTFIIIFNLEVKHYVHWHIVFNWLCLYAISVGQSVCYICWHVAVICPYLKMPTGKMHVHIVLKKWEFLTSDTETDQIMTFLFNMWRKNENCGSKVVCSENSMQLAAHVCLSKTDEILPMFINTSWESIMNKMISKQKSCTLPDIV